jgi:hypothetical protein
MRAEQNHRGNYSHDDNAARKAPSKQVAATLMTNCGSLLLGLLEGFVNSAHHRLLPGSSGHSLVPAVQRKKQNLANPAGLQKAELLNYGFLL